MTDSLTFTSSSSDEEEAAVDKAIQVYREIHFPPERIATQLVRSGYSIDVVRKRFPDVPLSQLPAPPSKRSLRAAAHTQSAMSRLGTRDADPQQLALNTMLEKITAARNAQSSPTEAAPTVAPGNSSSTELPPDPAGVSFQYVPLIQCSFPHADPGEVTSFTRRNGWLELTIATARPDTGLPYGVPARLLTIYCASEAIRTRSQEIYLGSSIHDFLRRLDIPITRGERGSLRVYANQLLRLAHCTLSIDENIQDASGRQGLHIRPALFVEDALLWWDKAGGVGEGSSLVLSSVLFKSILERSAPLSTVAIKQLRKSPMDLDVYAWLVHRLFHLSKPSAISWAQLSGQFGHNYGEIRYFRRFFGDSLKRVLHIYPEARIKVSDTGLMLLPSKPHVVPRPRALA